MDELIFTPAAILDMLMQIDELSEYDIELTEVQDGILLTIGDSKYQLRSSDPNDEVFVDDEVIDEIRDLKDAAYDGLEGVEVSENEDITSGVLKELFKSLLVGGMVRLTTRMLRQ